MTPIVLDLLRFEDAPLPTGTVGTPHPRRGLWAVLVLFAGLVAILWVLSKGVDRPDDEPIGAEIPEVGSAAVDLTTSTTVVATTASTTASTTTDASTTTSEQSFVNDVRGPVLGDDVDGVVVQIASRTLTQIDLSTGAVRSIDLEHFIYWEGSESGITLEGQLIAVRGPSIITTDLSDGSQLELRSISTDSHDTHLAGRASIDSVWLATYPEPNQISEAIELDLDGEVRRQVEIPHPFWVRSAHGDELILDSPDGSFRYDAATGVAVRMPGAVLALAPGLVITASCEESLECGVQVDRGSGPELVDWLSASDVFDGSVELSPDLTGALVHVYSQSGADYTFIDLRTGERVDLGRLQIDPYRGVVWVEGSSWIIGRGGSGRKLLAVDTKAGTQVDLALPPGLSPESFLAFIPSN